jgi:hypothetical protein
MLLPMSMASAAWNGEVGTLTDGDAEVGRERRRVVDSVAPTMVTDQPSRLQGTPHRPAATARLQRNFGEYVENHELLRNAVRGSLVVAGTLYHRHAHAQQTGASIIARAVRVLV